MKKIALISVVIGLLVFIITCGGDSPKAVMSDYFNCFDSFFTGLDNSENADDVAAALNKFSNQMEDMVPRMKALQENHPDLLKGMVQGGKMPEEYKEFGEKIKEILPKMMGLGAKLMQYGSDPKVMAAQKKFQEVMAK